MSNGKMKNGNKKAEDSDIEELSSGSDVEDRPRRKAGKDLPSAKDRAKEVVLGTSESDISDDDKKTSKKSKKKENGSEKSEKTKAAPSKRKGRSDPDFMKVKLDVTDSEEEVEKAKRRREKAKKKVLDSDENEIDTESPSKKNSRKRKRGTKSKTRTLKTKARMCLTTAKRSTWTRMKTCQKRKMAKLMKMKILTLVLRKK